MPGKPNDWPTFHVTPVALCIIFQCNLYIYTVSCPVEIKLFQNCFKLLWKSVGNWQQLRTESGWHWPVHQCPKIDWYCNYTQQAGKLPRRTSRPNSTLRTGGRNISSSLKGKKETYPMGRCLENGLSLASDTWPHSTWK